MDFYFRVYAKSSHHNIYDLTCALLRAGTNAPIQVSKIDEVVKVGSPWLPLHSCVSMSCPLPLIRLFLKSCPDQAKVFDKEGDLPIHIAVRNARYYNSTHAARPDLRKKSRNNFRSRTSRNLIPRPNNENNIPRNVNKKSLLLRQLRPKRQRK